MLRNSCSKKWAFICIDGLDEYIAEHRATAPGTRTSAAGRSQILPEIKKRLARRLMSVSISSNRGDIISYLHTRLAADRTLDAMGTPEVDILEKVPSDILEVRITCFNRLSSANRLLPARQKSRGATVRFCGFYITGRIGSFGILQPKGNGYLYGPTE